MPQLEFGADSAAGVDVGNIGCDTRCTSDIVEGEVTNFFVEFKEETQGLSDPAWGLVASQGT